MSVDTIPITDLAGYLAAFDTLVSAPSGSKADGRYRAVEQLVYHEGRAWTPQARPADVEKMPDRKCFANATTLVLARPDLTYVEGFADCGVVPLLHAWAVDGDGRVVDPTWGGDLAHGDYWGIAFATDWLAGELVRAGEYGLLANYRICRRLLRRGVPAAARITVRGVR